MAEFTKDWFGRYPSYWQALFAARGWRPDEPHMVVEIGSFEGRSALWILENLLVHPQSRLVCVDTFTGRDDPQSYWRRFEANVLHSPHAGKVEVAIGASLAFLSRFVADGRKADFIYVDGSIGRPR